MTLLAPSQTESEIIYPDSDGEPMSDNTLQFNWITTLKWEIEALFRNDPDVFVAGDLLWYPVQGDNRTRLAPDTMVAFGRPKGYRGSYKQWEEGNITPQVVFEIWSPGNSRAERRRKRDWYERFGVEEYYAYDPDTFVLQGWLWYAQTKTLEPIVPIDGWTSPRLGIRFEAPGDTELVIYHPDGTPFRSPLENREELEKAESERDQASMERDAANAERERLAAKLRELGIDPDSL
jgi:Uma2 family endonuclease